MDGWKMPFVFSIAFVITTAYLGNLPFLEQRNLALGAETIPVTLLSKNKQASAVPNHGEWAPTICSKNAILSHTCRGDLCLVHASSHINLLQDSPRVENKKTNIFVKKLKNSFKKKQEAPL